MHKKRATECNSAVYGSRGVSRAKTSAKMQYTSVPLFFQYKNLRKNEVYKRLTVFPLQKSLKKCNIKASHFSPFPKRMKKLTIYRPNCPL